MLLKLKLFGTRQFLYRKIQFWSRRLNTVCLLYRHFYDMFFTVKVLLDDTEFEYQYAIERRLRMARNVSDLNALSLCQSRQTI